VSQFDVGLISLHPDFRVQNIPGKLLSYLRASKPVLASVNSGNDLLRIVPDNGVGFCYVNGDDAHLAQAALVLARDAGLRAHYGSNGRKLLERDFSVTVAARQILGHFAPRPPSDLNHRGGDLVYP
jgi:O26-antigen biosynthesis N-acetyl-L-fucosamine transferase